MIVYPAMDLMGGQCVRLAQGRFDDVTSYMLDPAEAVLGFGGYVATPAYLAARRLGLPIVVHEQNVLPGLANKLAARLTRHVYTSFPQTPLPHATCIGLPLRRAIADLDFDEVVNERNQQRPRTRQSASESRP